MASPAVAIAQRRTTNIRPRLGLWAIGLGALAGGIVIGILLSIFTVVLPRKHELARVRTPTGFIADFDPLPAFQSSPLGTASLAENSDDQDHWGQRTLMKSYVIKCQVKYADQPNFLQAAYGAIESSGLSASTSRGVAIWSSRSSSTGGPGWRNDTLKFQYNHRAAQGIIQVWSVGRGDELVVIVTINEV